MAGVHDQDHQPVIVDRVQDPVVTCNPDPQNSVHSCEHLRARGPWILAQRFRCGLDALDCGPVELFAAPARLSGRTPARTSGTSRPEADFRPDLLGRYQFRARLDLGQRLARGLRVREVLQQLAELFRSQALQFGREFGRDDWTFTLVLSPVGVSVILTNAGVGLALPVPWRSHPITRRCGGSTSM
jgi:hypothetical protein